MDFAREAKLKLAEERKRLAEVAQSKGKKWLKRSEIHKIQTQGDDEAASSSSSSDKPPPLELPQTSSRSSSLTSPPPDTPEEDSALFSIPQADVVRRLRERGEPVRLFGESDRDRSIRLRQIEVLEPEINKGLRNDFKAALDKIEQEHLDEMTRQMEKDSSDQSVNVTEQDDGQTWDDIKTMAGKLGQNKDKDQETILIALKFLLNVWAKRLNSRPENEKRSAQGKQQSAIYSQTSDYLKPLFKQLKRKSTQPDIRDALARIVQHLLQREYVKANDSYLQMAIGNAPWPLGVTNVGIHQRTGREKIFAKYVAHVLNDETQRKYIQGLKRLMTFCQQVYPNEPSKCVDYGAVAR